MQDKPCYMTTQNKDLTEKNIKMCQYLHSKEIRHSDKIGQPTKRWLPIGYLVDCIQSLKIDKKMILLTKYSV
uniref:Uncharacterized protein n=1 Tax=Arundo donax TaxID=35708 RepID=A0A0A9HQA9_ARUDO